jgi:hypothetical protein
MISHPIINFDFLKHQIFEPYSFSERLRFIKIYIEPGSRDCGSFHCFHEYTYFINFHQPMRNTYGCGLRLLHIQHSIYLYSTVENEEMIFKH